jgi:hypothetical protein
VNVGLRDHRRQERDVVDTGCEMRQQVADPLAALAVAAPFPGAGHDRTRLALKQLDLAAGIEFLAGSPDDVRFIIECVALTGRARHEELYDPRGTGAVMQAAVPVGSRSLRGAGRAGECPFRAQEVSQRDRAKSTARVLQESAAT